MRRLALRLGLVAAMVVAVALTTAQAAHAAWAQAYVSGGVLYLYDDGTAHIQLTARTSGKSIRLDA